MKRIGKLLLVFCIGVVPLLASASSAKAVYVGVHFGPGYHHRHPYGYYGPPPGYYGDRYWVPGHWRWRYDQRQWIPGHWEYR